MSKEIIERIKNTENAADVAVREAREKARRIRDDAKAKSEAMIREARENGESEMEKAAAERESEYRAALAQARKAGAYEAAEKKAFARINFEKAVDFVVGRITG